MDPDFMIKLVEQLKPEECDNFQALGKISLIMIRNQSS